MWRPDLAVQSYVLTHFQTSSELVDQGIHRALIEFGEVTVQLHALQWNMILLWSGRVQTSWGACNGYFTDILSHSLGGGDTPVCHGNGTTQAERKKERERNIPPPFKGLSCSVYTVFTCSSPFSLSLSLFLSNL